MQKCQQKWQVSLLLTLLLFLLLASKRNYQHIISPPLNRRKVPELFKFVYQSVTLRADWVLRLVLFGDTRLVATSSRICHLVNPRRSGDKSCVTKVAEQRKYIVYIFMSILNSIWNVQTYSTSSSFLSEWSILPPKSGSTFWRI